MHRSAIGAISIDVPAALAPAARAFWQEALGRSTRSGTQHPEFDVLSGAFSGLTGLIQAIGAGPPGVHFDVHTDDVDAEVRRLVRIGATVDARHGNWVVLRDPAGMAFCVVPVDADDPLLSDAAAYDD